jgi:hypothetical protein
MLGRLLAKGPLMQEKNVDTFHPREDAMRDISDGITLRVRLNAVVETGGPGFIPREKKG